MPLLFDLEALSQRQTDASLEYIYKAVGGHDHDSEIWDEHWNPFIKRIVALFTERGLTRLEGVRRELIEWMQGEHHKAGALLPRPDGAMQRWGVAEIKLVRIYLESLPSDAWNLDDYMMLVDYLCQRHLSPDDLRTEADWLATRSTLMGRVQNALGDVNAKDVDKLLQAMPGTAAAAKDEFGFTKLARAVLDFSVNRSAELVTSLSDQARHQLRGIVARHVEARELGQESGPSLESELLDEFGLLNRDWRRIAVTEAGEAQAQGYVAEQKPGTKIQRVERYKNACNWCRKIDGAVVTVVSPSKADKDGETEVWPGKTNIGRSAAPRKRVGDVLVQREPEERYWIAAGTQHPHCRGSWAPTLQKPEGMDDDFFEWARGVLEAK